MLLQHHLPSVQFACIVSQGGSRHCKKTKELHNLQVKRAQRVEALLKIPLIRVLRSGQSDTSQKLGST